MRTILFMMVIILAALLFLTNFDNPWQEDVRHRLHAVIEKEPLKSIPSIMVQDLAHEDRGIPDRPAHEQETEGEVKEPKTANEPSLPDPAQEKKNISADPPASESAVEEIPAPLPVPPVTREMKNKEERLTSKEVKNLMAILDYARRKLLGRGRGLSSPASVEDPDGRAADRAENDERGDRSEIRQRLQAVAQEFGLDPKLAIGMAEVESALDPNAVSRKGAVGVMQVMPSTAKEHFGVSRDMLFDPEINIRVGLSWMKMLLDRFDQDLDLSLAAYNAGEERVIQAGYKIPPITETQDYVRKIKSYMEAGG